MSGNGISPTSLHNLFLTGFMGSGKSTVGPLLASALGRRFFDLDEVIEATAEKDITGIFRTEGESAFRDYETRALKTIGTSTRLIVALGGGSLIREENWQYIVENGTLLYLKASMDTLMDRIRSDSKARPLFEQSRMSALFAQRQSRYESATFQVDTEGKTPLDVAHAIIELFRETQ